MYTHVNWSAHQLHDISQHLLFTDIKVDSKLTVRKTVGFFWFVCIAVWNTFVFKLTRSSNNSLRQMPSRYFVASANCGTWTTTGSVDGWEVEVGKASWVPAVHGRAIIVGAGMASCLKIALGNMPSEIICPILNYSSSQPLLKQWNNFLWIIKL